MKICLINNRYKPYQKGGAERIVELTASGLAKAGNEVFVITTCPWRRAKMGSMPNIRIIYQRSLFLNLEKIPKAIRFFWHLLDMFDIGSFISIRWILKKEKPDLVISHNIKGIGQLVFLAIRSLKIKHIHYIHDIQLLHPSGLLLWGQEKKINSTLARVYQGWSKIFAGSPKLVISPSAWLLKEHNKLGFFRNSRKIIMLNPIDLGYIKGRAAMGKKEDNKFRLLYVGHMSEDKGIISLLAGFDKIKKEIGNVELVLLGSASKNRERELISAASKGVKYLGFLPSNEVFNTMIQSSLFIMPSINYENSPTVIYEAAAMGVPVLASQIGGIIELVEKLGGYLYRPGDADNLADKIKWIYNNYNEAKKLARRAKERIKDCDLDKYINNILDEIEQHHKI